MTGIAAHQSLRPNNTQTLEYVNERLNVLSVVFVSDRRQLLTGCVNNRLGHPAGERKQKLRRKAEELGLIGDRNIWVWEPKNEGP
jgi:hypothetical protein